MKKEGSLTIEASVALTVFMFIVVTILSFSTVYKAQSIVSHATLQTSQSLAIESYYRETISKSGPAELLSGLIKFADLIGFNSVNGIDDGYASLGDDGTNFYKIVKEKFAYAIAGDMNEASRVLESVGIEKGMEGLDFSYSSVKDGDIIVNVRYQVKLPFSFLGKRTLELSKTAKTKAFQKIENDNGYQEVQN